jgi:hypothetical protein
MRPSVNPRTKLRGPVPCLAILLAAVLLAAPGCLMQPTFSVKTTTADGVVVEVPLTKTLPVIEDDAMSVNRVLFTPVKVDKAYAITILFQLQFQKGQKPVLIAIDDVSDDPILNVMTVKDPVLTDKNHWNSASPPHNPADEYAKWMLTLDNTIKVYRFTVKLADGTTHVLRYPVYVPGMMKGYMRSQMGVTS